MPYYLISYVLTSIWIVHLVENLHEMHKIATSLMIIKYFKIKWIVDKNFEWCKKGYKLENPTDIHYETKGVLQLALQLNFWVVKDICNSLYLYVVSGNRQVTWVVELQLTVYTIQLIAIQLQLNQNNSFSSIMQLHHNCTYDAMLMSLIFIHLLKNNTWHYEDFWT
jgi:hypothetical protein